MLIADVQRLQRRCSAAQAKLQEEVARLLSACLRPHYHSSQQRGKRQAGRAPGLESGAVVDITPFSSAPSPVASRALAAILQVRCFRQSDAACMSLCRHVSASLAPNARVCATVWLPAWHQTHESVLPCGCQPGTTQDEFQGFVHRLLHHSRVTRFAESETLCPGIILN